MGSKSDWRCKRWRVWISEWASEAEWVLIIDYMLTGCQTFNLCVSASAHGWAYICFSVVDHLFLSHTVDALIPVVGQLWGSLSDTARTHKSSQTHTASSSSSRAARHRPQPRSPSHRSLPHSSFISWACTGETAFNRCRHLHTRSPVSPPPPPLSVTFPSSPPTAYFGLFLT